MRTERGPYFRCEHTIFQLLKDQRRLTQKRLTMGNLPTQTACVEVGTANHLHIERGVTQINPTLAVTY